MADPTPDGEGLAPLVDRLKRLERKVEDLESPSGTQRALAVRRLPLQDFRVGRTSGFGMRAGWATYATVTLPVPEDRTLLQVLAIGVAAVLDQTSGGLTSSSGRILLAGTPSIEFPAAKDAGASMVNNVITATSGGSLDVTGLTSVTVDFQLLPLNAAAFPPHAQNFAQLAVIGSFTIA